LLKLSASCREEWPDDYYEYAYSAYLMPSPAIKVSLSIFHWTKQEIEAGEELLQKMSNVDIADKIFNEYWVELENE
jgi:hypothetical protein